MKAFLHIIGLPFFLLVFVAGALFWVTVIYASALYECLIDDKS